MESKCRGSRANALKHGLSARLLIPEERDRVTQLIALLAPDCEEKEVWHAARQAAEAWLYCEKVSRSRSEIIDAAEQWAKTENRYGSDRNDRQTQVHMAKASDRLLRYERRAMKQLEAALENLQLLLSVGVR